jgi:predicted PurR-regulated permease PerM
MLRILEGCGVLLLLSVFFAYVLAPAVAAVRRRIRFGRRRRPISDASAILLLYLAILVPGMLVWRRSAGAVAHWVNVTAPRTVDHVFAGRTIAPLERLIAAGPFPSGVRAAVLHGSARAAGSLERETRSALDDCIAAARYAPWLAVAPVIAFLLLTGVPVFQRSALRVLPRGHLQWRAEEYVRDVNSALAGYIRAQVAAALIVGTMCSAGFLLLGVPSAVSLGVTAGVLELVPAIGPLTALLVVSSQAGGHLLGVILFLGALRVLQDYVIYPRLIRHGMHLSTLAVILTIWGGATLAGAPGVILAIPVAGFISVSIRHWREYREIEQLVDARRHEAAEKETRRLSTALGGEDRSVDADTPAQ